MATRRLNAFQSLRLWHAPTSALLLWGCLWCNLNTGFWNITFANSVYDWQLSIRAALPFIVIPVAALVLLRKGKLALPKTSPSRLLFIYGIIVTFASIFSPGIMASLYWSLPFLGTILAAWTFIDRGDPLESSRQLLTITWVATFIVAAIIGYQARNSVFGDTATGYGVIGELNGLSRSSGVARWAAVPGLVCLIRAYHTRRSSHIALYLGSAAFSFFIVYRMQSRGAVFGSVAALLFSLLVSSRMRRYALPFAGFALIVIFLLDSPATVSNNVATYIKRGQTKEEFLSMTGRTRTYEHGIAAFEDAPIFGRGQWADRIVIHEHVHNSFLQALLNGGVVGGIPYIASWVAGWLLFYRLQKKNALLGAEDRVHVLESGAVMMFFTVRAIPETTTASFAVDQMVVVAIYVYLECLTLQTHSKKLQQVFQRYYPVSVWANKSRTTAKVLGERRI
ncbi:MAG: O-antigen ligase family protein [Anaerolineaceae bacterium]|nr:O-antigen ligase family protein [Anaerolineaceae bacterium]